MISAMECLNLGCGNRFHPEWVNIDTTSNSPYVKAHDLRHGIPFQDKKFDVVYHSHLLEHFSQTDAIHLMDQCFRVLKHGGIIRVALPDLETLARIYLEALKGACGEGKDWQHHYDWIMLELYDQAVRLSPGGNMLTYLKQKPIPNERFVMDRIGEEGRRIQRLNDTGTLDNKTLSTRTAENPFRPRWRAVREMITKLLLKSEDYYALRVGRFRLQGEVHQWMYDRFSLNRLLQNAGFSSIKQRGALESYIPNWSQYHLDSDANGTIFKPDSLFMEGLKPIQ
jgi:predicted SAM-dependent methyltransferase